MNKKKITFKNESYIKKNQDQFLYWKQWIDPKIIIFLKLILQKINFALWTCDSKWLAFNHPTHDPLFIQIFYLTLLFFFFCFLNLKV